MAQEHTMVKTTGEKPKILIIDDDPDFLTAAAAMCQEMGEVVCHQDPREASTVLHLSHVIVTDLVMNQMNGRELLKKVKEQNIISPVIMVTGFADKEVALDAANLHVFAILEKPIECAVFKGVVQNAIDEYHRRCRLQLAAAQYDRTMAPPDLELDEASQCVRSGCRVIQLTNTEFRLLSLLHDHRGQRLSRREIVEAIWGDQKIVHNSLDTYFGSLKKKIPGFSKMLRVVRGKGYVFLGD